MFKKKLIAVMNKNIEPGIIMNALAHMSFGLGTSIKDKDECKLTNYKDNDGNDHRNISEIPFIILRANSNKIRNTRNQAIEDNIDFVDFNDTMTIGTFQEQIIKAQNTKEKDLNYYGIVLFGDYEKISEMTKKFSLWR